MEKSSEKISKQFIREDGLLKIGSKVIMSTTINKKLSPGIGYTVSDIYEDNINNLIFIEFLETGKEKFNADDFKIIPTEFDVYKWKGYYILALSIEQAQRIWKTWIDKLSIMAADGGSQKLFKFINNLINTQDKELFPYRIGIKCEYIFPCIVEDLEWEKEPLFVYKCME